MTFITSEGKPVSMFNACGTRAFEPASMTPHTAEAKIDFVENVKFPAEELLIVK